MSDEKTIPDEAAQLRRQAEEKAAQETARMPEDLGALSPEEQRRLLHELRVHQIELEMQNDELRATQAQLEASRERYFDLYDLAPVGYVTLSEEGLIQEANLTAATMLGMERQSLAGQPLTRFIESEDQDVYYLHRKQLFETETAQVCEIRMLRSGSGPFWVRVDAALAREADGGRVCRAAVSDIDERKRAEEVLRECERQRYEILDNKIDAVLLTVPDGRILSVNTAACRMFGRSEAEICRLGRAGIIDVADPRLATAVEERGRTGRFEGELTGVRADGARFPVEVSTSVFVAADGQARTVMVIRDISERKAKDEELQLTRERLELAVAGADLGTYDIDQARRLAVVDRRYLDMLGYAPGEVEISRELLQSWMHPDDRAEVDRAYGAHLRGETRSFDLEYRVRHKAGRWVWVRDRGRVVAREADGTPRRVIGTHLDVTLQRTAETELREALDWQRRIFDGSRDAVFISDEQGRFTAVNVAAERLTGYSRAELLAMRIPDLHEASDLHAFDTFHSRIMAGEEILSETPIWRKDGSKVDAEFSNSSFEIGGRRFMHTAARDVTARKRADRALEESERRFRTLAESSPLGMYETDASGACVYVNRKWLELAGLTSAEALGDGWRQGLHEEDRERVFQLWRGHALLQGPWETEFRFRRPDGRVTLVLGTATALRDADGRVTGFLGVNLDITDRRRAAEALAASERLAAATIDALSANLCVVDESGVIVAVNRAWRDFAGANRAIVGDVSEGANYLAACDGVTGPDAETAAAFAGAIRAVLGRAREGFTLEYPCHSPDEERWFVGRVTPFMAEGRPRAVIVHTDITKRKQAEVQLRREHDRLRALSSQLSTAEEQERRRLASTLHEQVGQLLALSRLKLGVLAEKPGAAGIAGQIDEIRSLVDQVLAATRTLTFELAPPVLYRVGVAAAVEWYAERLMEQVGLTVACTQRGVQPTLSATMLGFLFSALRELLHNVVKHAHTDHARVVLEWGEETLAVSVEDDGAGFDPDIDGGDRDDAGCFGMLNIRERLRDMGGRLDVESAPGKGTRAKLTVPRNGSGKWARVT